MFAICVVSVVCAVICVNIKKSSPELAFTVSIGMCGAGIMYVVKYIFCETNLFSVSLLSNDLIVSAVKCMMISFVSKPAIDCCKSYGQASAAFIIDIASCVSSLIAAKPILMEVINTANGFLS